MSIKVACPVTAVNRRGAGTAAQARGVKLGRKPKLSRQQVAHARQLREQGQRSRQIAQVLKVS